MGPPGLVCLAGSARGVYAQRGLARLVQQRGKFVPAGLIDREDDAADVGLGPVKHAVPTGLGRRFGDLREGAGDGLCRKAAGSRAHCSSLREGDTVAQ